MKDIAVIIVAAGESKRLKVSVRKPYLILRNKPILRHSIDVFRSIPTVKEIIIAINPKDTKRAEWIIGKFDNIRTVIGGARRADSVFNALQTVSEKSKIVLVHDAARPFIRRTDVINLIKKARKSGAAILAIPVNDTIKKTQIADCRLQIAETVTPRESLWAAQTPQGFKREVLVKAFCRFKNKRYITDDAQLVEMLGIPVSIVPGSEDNIKITTKADIK